MLSSAVSLGFAWVCSMSGPQLDGGDIAAWRRIEPNIVRVMSGTRALGSGVLIDSNGYFFAHRSVTGSPVLFGKLASGETIQLSVTSIDDVTQLALLHAEGWKAAGRTPVSVQANSSAAVQKASISNATRILLVTGQSTLRGELTQSNLVGVMSPSRRGLTLSEIRFEDPGGPYGGGLIFTLDGRLVGVVGASLEAEGSKEIALNRAQADSATAGVGGGGGGLGAFGNLLPGAVAKKAYGPSSMTVGYTVTPDILERVVEGFRSPSRQVAHPALGLMCQDSQNGGALVVNVTTGSAAHQAGIRPGDVLLELGGSRVSNQIEYTRVLVRQRVGDSLAIKLRRGTEEITLTVRVGK